MSRSCWHRSACWASLIRRASGQWPGPPRRRASRWSSARRLPRRWKRWPRQTATASGGTSCTGPRTGPSPRVSSAGRRRPVTAVLVVTLDTRMLAWRPRDLDNGYLPFLQGVGDAELPVRSGVPGRVWPARSTSTRTRPYCATPRCSATLSLTWDDIPFLRQHWNGPIVLKGILSAADAVRAAEAGVDGIIVSNHGGRQVDGAIGALDALPAVARGRRVPADRAVRQRHPRRRRHAQGAGARRAGSPDRPRRTLTGWRSAARPACGMCCASLRTDFELTMRLAGLPRLSELGPDCLQRRP